MAVCLTLLLTFFLVFSQNRIEAVSEYKLIGKVNYAKLNELAKQFNVTLSFDNASKTYTLSNRYGVTVLAPLNSKEFTRNGKVFEAQIPLHPGKGGIWISVKDFADLFGLEARYYKGQQSILSSGKQKSKNDQKVKGSAAYVNEKYGNTTPYLIMKHGSPNNISGTNPIKPDFEKYKSQK